MIARLVLLSGRVVGICTPPRTAAGVALVAIVVVVGSKILAVVAWVEVDACPRLVRRAMSQRGLVLAMRC